MTVVSPDELDHFVPAGECAGEAQCAHHRLGPRVDEADHLHAGHEAADQARELQLERARSAEARSSRGGSGQRRQDARVRVPEHQRPPRQDVVDVAVPVDVEQPGPFAPVDEQRIAPDGLESPHGRVDASGQKGDRLGEQAAGFFSRMLRFLHRHMYAPCRTRYRRASDDARVPDSMHCGIPTPL